MRVVTYLVPPEDGGRLLKHLLRGRLGLSGGQYRSIKFGGRCLVDGAPLPANAPVRAGQLIEVTLSDALRGAAQPDDGPVNIVYLDDDVMVIDKPAPLNCQATPRQPERALENRLMGRFAGQAFAFRPVNRLDRGTSGLLVAAMHPHAQWALQRLLHTPGFERAYLAVVVGRPDPAEGVIDAPIAKCDGPTVKREVASGGRPSRTAYRTLLSGERSLVALKLFTGRTHQIRVHMAHIGCPVAGDFLYGAEDGRLPGRFALHSAAVRFPHPIDGRAMAFYSPLPRALAALLPDGEAQAIPLDFLV